MLRTTEQLRDKIPYDVFTDSDVKSALRDVQSDDARYGRMRRCFRHSEILRLRRGLYVFAPRYRRTLLNTYRISNLLVAPSYVSLLSALQHHELVPERIETVQAVSRDRSRTYRTAAGIYTYRHHGGFSTIGVSLRGEGAERALIASPTRAIADLLYLGHAPNLQALCAKIRLDESFRPDLRELRAMRSVASNNPRMIAVCREIEK